MVALPYPEQYLLSAPAKEAMLTRRMECDQGKELKEFDVGTHEEGRA